RRYLTVEEAAESCPRRRRVAWKFIFRMATCRSSLRGTGPIRASGISTLILIAGEPLTAATGVLPERPAPWELPAPFRQAVGCRGFPMERQWDRCLGQFRIGTATCTRSLVE